MFWVRIVFISSVFLDFHYLPPFVVSLGTCTTSEQASPARKDAVEITPLLGMKSSF